jgi:uncharacterized protein with FMN-binding domain
MRRVILAALSTVAGLTVLLSFKTRPRATVASPPTAAAASPGTTNSNSQAASGSGGGPSTASPTTRTVTGTAAETRYGPVQVKITITNGRLSAVEAVEYPEESPRDEQINSYAIPQLNQEAVAAKSAKIDMVSGATYTSTGYITSLQSALDQAGGA